MMSDETKRFPFKCSDCGKEDSVPFPVDKTRAFRCQDCLRKYREARKDQRA